MVKLKDRKNYLLFASYDAFQRFLSRKMTPEIEGAVEYCIMRKYPGRRILFTAEHAQTTRIPLKDHGEDAYAGVGDWNTDVLTKMGSYYLDSAYLIPKFVRTKADASRPPEELGNGLRLFVKPKNSDSKSAYVPIHKDKSFLDKLKRYHEVISEIEPKGVISVHGINRKRKFDMLFGFGEDYGGIGSKKRAFQFKNRFIDYLDSVFSDFGVKADLKIGVSTWRFTGSQNHVLTTHVINHNKKAGKDDKRIGMQVEMNLRGRASKHDDRIPTIPYQLMIQALGDFTFKWMCNHRN